MNKIKTLILLLATVFIIKGNAFAVPLLQVYVEGSTYNAATGTWTTGSSDFILWVLGNVKQKKENGTYVIHNIMGVQLSAAYPTGESGNIELIPTTVTAGLLPAPGDTTTPGSPTYLYSGNGTRPPKSDGRFLPAHGIYGPGTSWNAYLLGDFTERDTPIGDYTAGACPGGLCTYPDYGQINAYEVKINGYSWVHFDAFDHIEGDTHARFAPFSHDAEAVVPEPASLSLLGLGLMGLVGLKKKKLS